MTGATGRRLVVWALATFHATLFVLLPLYFLYRAGVLAHVLAGLNTAVGLALFLALWLTTYYVTRRAFKGLRWHSAGVTVDGAVLYGRALRWGGLNGVLFLAILALGLLLATLVGTPGLGALSFFVFVGPIALVVAFAVGAGSGVVLGLIDLWMLAAARRIVASSTEGAGTFRS